MSIHFLFDQFKHNSNKNAILWRDRSYSYGWLTTRIDYWMREFEIQKIGKGQVVVLEADFSPNSIALFLSLIERKAIIVPLTPEKVAINSPFVSVAMGEMKIVVDLNDEVHFTKLPNTAVSDLYRRLREQERPGLVLFSSGTTGEPKAAVHDVSKILKKFEVRRHSRKTIAFLLFDHIGGINTMFYTLSNIGCLVTVRDRTPDSVLLMIAKYKVEMLPTSPTFLNLVLLTGAYDQYDLSSLKLITYGTEPMPESTLNRLHALFPKIELLQTYGLSEIGILRSKSKSSDSLFVKIGGEGFETRIIDGILQVKAESAMLGYLNAPSPFTDDGWLITGDYVSTDGDYVKILGRKSEIINVGGQKVNPVEVEGVIQELQDVLDVTVYGEKNFLLGQIVCADVVLKEGYDEKAFPSKLSHYCRGRLENYKIPVKIKILDRSKMTAQIKKSRRIQAII